MKKKISIARWTALAAVVAVLIVVATFSNPPQAEAKRLMVLRVVADPAALELSSTCEVR